MDLDVREKESPETATADVEIVRKALAGVARAKGSAGMIAVASMLAGEITERVKSTRLDRLSTFGILAGKSPDDVLVILRVLLANGWIDLTSNEYPVPLMTPAGWKVMKAEVPIRVRLPATGKKLKKRSATKASKNEATRSARAEVDANQADRELFDALRRYRAKIAKERGLPAYVIATDRTLLGIATTKPSSLRALHEVHGMGPARMASFGEAFLEVVRKPEHSS